MMPKVIHYCWFGRNPLPELALKCINSWKKYLPDYEIKEWNEDNFDVNIIPYTEEAYSVEKYAFVSDYARLWILYQYGGVYFDTDVEVIRPLDDILLKGAFMGCQRDFSSEKLKKGYNIICAPGLGLACMRNHNFYKQMLDMYSEIHFINSDGSYNQTTIVTYTTKMLVELGLKHIREIQCVEGIYIYPAQYFCPIDFSTGKKNITKKTRTIHHFAASWLPDVKLPLKDRIKKTAIRTIGYKKTEIISRYLKIIKVI